MNNFAEDAPDTDRIVKLLDWFRLLTAAVGSGHEGSVSHIEKSSGGGWCVFKFSKKV